MKKVLGLLLLGLVACGGNSVKNCIPGSNDTLHNQLVCDSSEFPKNVSFVLAGKAACSECLDNDFPIAGLYVNVFAADVNQLDVLDPIATTMTGGLGPFELQMTAIEGTRLRINGQLFRDSEEISEAVTLDSSVEITAPSEDGEVVAFTLNFPQEN